MRILAFASEFPPCKGGIGTYAAEIARAAVELGAHVSMVAPDYGLDTSAVDASLPYRLIRYAGGPHRMRDLGAKVVLMARLMRRERCDLVHVMDWPFFLPAALQGRRCRRLHTVHGTDVFDMARLMKATAIRSARMFSGNFEVVANSRYTLEAFRANFPYVAAEKTRHVLLGVGDEWLAPPVPVEEARRALNLPADKFIITTTARLVPRKNHLGILEAISRLPPELKAKVCYLIVGPEGDADYVARLKNVIASTGVDARLMGVPDNHALRKIYAASDLFCLLGRQIAGGPVEGFGLVYLEAGGQGVPALAADTGGVKEVVLHRQNGLLVPAGDTAAATAALAELIENPGLLADLRQGALQRARHLSWRRCAAETYGLELGAGC